MDSTPFSKKCEILGNLYLFYSDTTNESWRQFFTWADLGLPMAWMASSDWITIKPDAKQYVNDTWKMFCEMIAIDADAKYNSLQDCFTASPNPPLADDEG